VRLVDFVREATSSFDKSHDCSHAVRVMLWSVLIADTELVDYDFDLLVASALLHDVRDHKYPESVSEESVVDLLRTIYFDKQNLDLFTKTVIDITKNVSFSK
jgi:HD superfamily phosphodiesterase